MFLNCTEDGNHISDSVFPFQWIGLRKDPHEALEVPIKYGAFL